MMKGSVLDVLFIMIALLIIAICTILAFLMNTSIGTAFSDAGFSAETSTIFSQGSDSIELMDGLFAFILVGLFIAVIVSSLYIDTHPIFFAIAIMLAIILVPITAQITNMFDAFATNTNIITSANNFPITIQIMRNLPLICLVLIMTVAIILFAKSRGGGA